MAATGDHHIQPEEFALLDALPEKPVVFDVGANTGHFTAAVLERRPAATVRAFEAQETARRAFSELHRDVPVWGGLGARHERRILYSDAPASELGTFYPRPALPMIDEKPVGEITIWPLTELWIEFGVEHVDLMKIDVEGAELEVLQGAAPILHRFDAIYWEWIGGETRYTDNTIADFAELLANDFDIEPLTDLAPDGDLQHYIARRRP